MNHPHRNDRRCTRGPNAGRQRGTVLIIALIVLVAMTLAGIATMRSVDTASLVAGNIAFKQSGVNASDQGLQAAFNWLSGLSGTATLYNDDNALGVSSKGYYSSPMTPATASPMDPKEPDWTASGNWTKAAVLAAGTPDASGNVVYYIIERMCPNTGSTSAQTCGSTPDTAIATGQGIDLSQQNFFTLPPAIHYRITSKVEGPHNSFTIVQTMMRTQ